MPDVGIELRADTLPIELPRPTTDDEELKDLHPLIWDQLDMHINETKILTLKMGY